MKKVAPSALTQDDTVLPKNLYASCLGGDDNLQAEALCCRSAQEEMEVKSSKVIVSLRQRSEIESEVTRLKEVNKDLIRENEDELLLEMQDMTDELKEVYDCLTNSLRTNAELERKYASLEKERDDLTDQIIDRDEGVLTSEEASERMDTLKREEALKRAVLLSEQQRALRCLSIQEAENESLRNEVKRLTVRLANLSVVQTSVTTVKSPGSLLQQKRFGANGCAVQRCLSSDTASTQFSDEQEHFEDLVPDSTSKNLGIRKKTDLLLLDGDRSVRTENQRKTSLSFDSLRGVTFGVSRGGAENESFDWNGQEGGMRRCLSSHRQRAAESARMTGLYVKNALIAKMPSTESSSCLISGDAIETRNNSFGTDNKAKSQEPKCDSDVLKQQCEGLLEDFGRSRSTEKSFCVFEKSC